MLAVSRPASKATHTSPEPPDPLGAVRIFDAVERVLEVVAIDDLVRTSYTSHVLALLTTAFAF